MAAAPARRGRACAILSGPPKPGQACFRTAGVSGWRPCRVGISTTCLAGYLPSVLADLSGCRDELLLHAPQPVDQVLKPVDECHDEGELGHRRPARPPDDGDELFDMPLLRQLRQAVVEPLELPFESREIVFHGDGHLLADRR